jgi:hypothetical protein
MVLSNPLLSQLVHAALAIAAVAVFTLAVVYVFIRGVVMGVVLDDDHIVVRGLLYSRSSQLPITAFC